VASLSVTSAHANTWSVYDKTIPELANAYITNQTTVSDVVGQYLERINTFNKAGGGGGTLGTGGRGINGVAQVNPNLTADVAAVQALINGGATLAQFPLLGVPVLVKDSYDAIGMTTTNGVSVLNGSGTPGSTTLMPQQDAFSVARLKAAGAVIIGKATQTTMAYGTTGLGNSHGVVTNPYNPVRNPGGSSSGTGAAIASQFAMLGMGGETGGSIRIPSNHNALVGLKTSAGLIDPSGTWPLSPARDVAGPMAKTVTDVAYSLNAMVATSPTNLWNNTPFYPTAGPQPGANRPADYTTQLSTTALQGKVLAVPRSMIQATNTPGAYEGATNPVVMTVFNAALAKLQSEGATIVYVDVPASTTYYNTLARNTARGGPATTTGFSYAYPTTTVGGNVPSNTWSAWSAAFYYNELIKSYNDPVIKNLNDFAAALSAGSAAGAGSIYSTLGGSGAVTNITNLAVILNAGNAKGFGDANNDGVPDNPDAMIALQAFSDLRVNEFEGFMADPYSIDDPTTLGIDESTLVIDAFVAPTFGTVAGYVTTALRPVGTPVDPYAAPTGTSYAALLGRFESNILGGPSLSVPMGYAPDGTPMGIQFFNGLGGESSLLGLGYDYEQATLWRVNPDLAFVPEPGMGLVAIVSGLALLKRRRRTAANA